MDDDLIENIIKIMESKKISQRQLAKLTGIPRSTIGYNLSGKTRISGISAHKIADALNVTIEYLRFGYEPIRLDNRLFDISSKLNEDGNKKLMDYAEDLLENPKYKK